MKHLGLTALTCFFSAATLAETDLKFVNPGFEQMTHGWANANAMSVVIPQAARTGKLGLRVQDQDDRQGSSLTSSPLPVTPGKTYALRFWARNPQQRQPVGVYVRFLNHKRTSLNTHRLNNELSFPVPPTQGWKMFTFVNRAPENAAYIQVWIHSFQAATGNVDFDDFRLTQLNRQEEAIVKTSKMPQTGRRTVKFPVPEKERIEQIAAMLPEHPQAAFPVASQREPWEAFKKHPRATQIIRYAQDIANTPPPYMDPKVYLQFTKTGNRTNYERLTAQRSRRLQTLTLAEALEYKGRFIRPLERDLKALLQEKSWTLPAHDAALTNFNQTAFYGDLVATDLAKHLAFTLYLLQDRLDPQLRQKIRDEVLRRVFEPYRKVIRTGTITNGHWWSIGPSNWNAVCTDNMVRAALAFFDSKLERAEFVAAMEKAIPFFLSGFTPDGYCSEGMAYWSYGFGHYLQLAEAVLRQTQGKINLYQPEIVKRICEYPKNLQIDEGVCPAFADCGVRACPDNSALLIIQRRFPQALLKRIAPAKQCPMTLNQADSISFFDDTTYAKLAPEQPTFPLRSLFPQAGIYVGRDLKDLQKRFGTAIKAGHNNEFHNHNDVGSFTVVLNKKQYFLDPGGEIYTRRTFSSRRYDSQMLNSYGHMVPVVAGKLQPTGPEAKGIILKTDFTDAQDTLVIDLKKAYHNVPELKSLIRTFTFNREANTVTVRDDVEFTTPQSFETPLVSYEKLIQETPNSITAYDFQGAVRATFTVDGAQPKVTWGEIQNEHATNPKRVAVAVAQPVRKAAITIVFTPRDRQDLPGMYKPLDPNSFQADMTKAILIQAEDLAGQRHGNVQVTSKIGDSGKSFKLWDDQKHQLIWNLNVTGEETYAIQIRACSEIPMVARNVSVDGKLIHPEGKPVLIRGTGGWSNATDNWQTIWLATSNPDARPLLVTLKPGKHTLAMTNVDGYGLNLDWIKLVPAKLTR